RGLHAEHLDERIPRGRADWQAAERGGRAVIVVDSWTPERIGGAGGVGAGDAHMKAERRGAAGVLPEGALDSEGDAAGRRGEARGPAAAGLKQCAEGARLEGRHGSRKPFLSAWNMAFGARPPAAPGLSQPSCRVQM